MAEAKTRVVRAGDRIGDIAFAEYADARKWRPIADVNRLQDPLRLDPGARLVIPALDAAGRVKDGACPSLSPCASTNGLTNHSPIQLPPKTVLQRKYAIGRSLGQVFRCLTGKAPPEAPSRIPKDTLEAPSKRGLRLPITAEQAILRALDSKRCS